MSARDKGKVKITTATHAGKPKLHSQPPTTNLIDTQCALEKPGALACAERRPLRRTAPRQLQH